MQSDSDIKPAISPRADRNPSDDLVVDAIPGKAVVLCLGNRYLRDDGVGIMVAEALKGSLGRDVLVVESRTIDLSLVSLYEGASKVIVVDAMESGATPGEVSRCVLVPNGKTIEGLAGSHAMQLHEIFDVARQTGLLKCAVIIVGVEPKDCGIGEGLTPEVKEAIPRVVAEVRASLQA